MSTALQIDKATLLRIAAEAYVDPRTVTREIRAFRGECRHVRGWAGERIRHVLERHGLIERRAA